MSSVFLNFFIFFSTFFIRLEHPAVNLWAKSYIDSPIYASVLLSKTDRKDIHFRVIFYPAAKHLGSPRIDLYTLGCVSLPTYHSYPTHTASRSSIHPLTSIRIDFKSGSELNSQDSLGRSCEACIRSENMDENIQKEQSIMDCPNSL